MTVAETERSAQRAARRRWLAVVVLCLGQLVIVVDGTVVNVALPVIERSLHFSQASLAWVVNAYLVTFGGLLLLAGRVGDLLGRKRVFLFGLTLFTAASALCGAAQSQSLLIAARFVQGIGAAFSSSMVLGILVTIFPRPAERARAMTGYAIVGNVGGSIGLLLGGVLTDQLNWHWIFFINVPIGVVGVVFAAVLLDSHSGIGINGSVDWVGGAIVVVAPTMLVYGIVNAASHGWTSLATLSMIGAAVLLAGLFVGVERRSKNPLVPLRVFRMRRLMGANLIRVFHGLGMSTVFFCGALYLQHVLGYSPVLTGFAFFPLNIVIGAFSVFVTARLIRRVGPSKPLVPGFVCLIASLCLLARAPVHGSYVLDVLPALALFGVGASFVFLPSVTIAMADAGPSESGLASGLTNVSLQIGVAIGTALAASLSASETIHELARGVPLRSALTTGYHVAFLMGAAGPLLGAVFALVMLRGMHRPLGTPDEPSLVATAGVA